MTAYEFTKGPESGATPGAVGQRPQQVPGGERLYSFEQALMSLKAAGRATRRVFWPRTGSSCFRSHGVIDRRRLGRLIRRRKPIPYIYTVLRGIDPVRLNRTLIKYRYDWRPDGTELVYPGEGVIDKTKSA